MNIATILGMIGAGFGVLGFVYSLWALSKKF